MKKMIRKHFARELEKIKKQILSLGAKVEEQVRMATQAVEAHDAELAKQIIKSDFEIDEMEVEIEEECLKILALHQPVAVDLRFLIAVIKINNDLERIGDQAVNIAERVDVIAKLDLSEFFFDYTAMGEKVQDMLKMSLDALVNMDYDTAYSVVMRDDEVDQIKVDAYDRIKQAMSKHPDKIGYLINLLLISRHLERLADHATNIAEEVIYLIEGEIVRHAAYNRE
ncbi:MAG: phosphate signaling complex protein PhoU [Desulfobacteraceae bacterium]|jgi:phosphate transport system protein|nr:phosphate signaling complex protein PhoU [Desulfobacteraceae bacterium]